MLILVLLTCAALGGDTLRPTDPKVRAAYAAQLLEAEAQAAAREVAAQGRLSALTTMRERGDLGALAAASGDAHLAQRARELAIAEREAAQVALVYGEAHPTRIAGEKRLTALKAELAVASDDVLAAEGALAEIARAERHALAEERARLGAP